MSRGPGTSKHPEDGPVGIKALDADGIRALIADLGQPPYRARQLIRWLYRRGASSFEEMSDLPSGLRFALAERFTLPVAIVVDRQISIDGTRKYLVELGDGTRVECVGIPAGARLTVCFSTQAGCAMGCAFCATGQDGLVRDLYPGEMVDQLLVVSRDLGRRVTNAVAMGQGEPFANYDATIGALRLMNSPDGLGIGARHLTVSTCGLPIGIARLATEPEQFTLAVSLHSAVQATRDTLMPGISKVMVARLRDALIEYAHVSGRRPTLEYALIDGVNDSEEELQALIEFARATGGHVNLIPINPVAGSRFRQPSRAAVRRFAAGLAAAGIEVSIRAERGADIDAACGQLGRRSR